MCVSRAVLLYSPVCGVCIVSYCCPVRGVPNRPLQIETRYHYCMYDSHLNVRFALSMVGVTHNLECPSTNQHYSFAFSIYKSIFVMPFKKNRKWILLVAISVSTSVNLYLLLSSLILHMSPQPKRK